MWYFSWILGVALACCFGILNGVWYELKQKNAKESSRDSSVK